MPFKHMSISTTGNAN